jgi:hypothetical protein
MKLPTVIVSILDYGLFLLFILCYIMSTLESGIDVGQGINVGHGNFAKKNKRRALNKRRA